MHRSLYCPGSQRPAPPSSFGNGAMANPQRRNSTQSRLSIAPTRSDSTLAS